MTAPLFGADGSRDAIAPPRPQPVLSPLTYPVVETFHSLQGEGVWMGYSAFFIRLGGCDVGCWFCDTKESWPQDHHPRQSVADLVEAAIAAQPFMVVITGGEPLMHDLAPLTQALKQAGLRIHLETSGAHPFSGEFDWVTLSPKSTKPPHSSVYGRVDELKGIVSTRADFDWIEQQAAQVPQAAVRSLQPEWSSSTAPDWVMGYVLRHPQWRVSLQTHKFLGVR